MIIPTYANLKEWASSLVVDFPFDNIPNLNENNNWKQWGNAIINQPTFIASGAPSPNNYNDWREWAYNLYLTVGTNN